LKSPLAAVAVVGVVNAITEQAEVEKPISADALNFGTICDQSHQSQAQIRRKQKVKAP
jgi:hypothetical protein